MAIQQPPPRDSKRFDDWMFLLWKQLGTIEAAASAAGFGTNSTASGAVTLAAGYSAYIPQQYEIGAAGSLEIGAGSYFEIG